MEVFVNKLSKERAAQLALKYVNKGKNENYNLELIGVEESKISPTYWAETSKLEH